MELHNKKTGEKMDVSLRVFANADAESIIECIRNAYGENYAKPYLYAVDEIISHNDDGSVCFCVAETADGDVVGIVASEQSPFFPDQVETSCQVILKRCTGFGLALPLALYQHEQARLTPHTSFFARCLGTHVISQKVVQGMGFTHCGFIPNVFNKEAFKHEGVRGNYTKIAQTVATRKGTKSDAGTLYLPMELWHLAELVYDDLGMIWQRSDGISALEGIGQRTQLLDQIHTTLTLWAITMGADFATWLAQRVDEVAKLGALATVTLYLNANDPSCVVAYHIARSMGFVCTGFFPCTQEGEFLMLHAPLMVPFHVDHIPFISAYEPFATEIRRQQDEK